MHRSALRARPDKPTIRQLVEEQRDEIDSLLAELADGPRSARHYEQLEEQAAAIGNGLRAAFRRGRVG